MTRKKLFLFGIQRSGSNYTQSFINKYINARVDNEQKGNNIARNHLMHKHCRFYLENEYIPTEEYKNSAKIATLTDFYKETGINKNDIVLVVYKSPEDWLLSIKSWADKCGWRDSYEPTNDFNAFYLFFLKLRSENFVFINYSQLLSKYGALKFILKMYSFGFSPKSKKVLASLLKPNGFFLKKVPVSEERTKREIKTSKGQPKNPSLSWLDQELVWMSSNIK